MDAPRPPDALQIQDLPILTPGPEQVLIKVAAFGRNRSELHTWLGLAQGLTFSRVLGIEAAGTVAACPGGQFPVCQQDLSRLGIEPNGQGAVNVCSTSGIAPFVALSSAVLNGTTCRTGTHV
jgi:NADPH:quinone reductase-like Zn-dependent oxidoreductase